jgi:hypothetical protein
MPLMLCVDKSEGQVEPSPRNLKKCRVPVSEDEDEDDHRYFDVEGGDEVGVQATSPTDRYVRSCRITGSVGMLILIFRFVFGAK